MKSECINGGWRLLDSVSRIRTRSKTGVYTFSTRFGKIFDFRKPQLVLTTFVYNLIFYIFRCTSIIVSKFHATHQKHNRDLLFFANLCSRIFNSNGFFLIILNLVVLDGRFGWGAMNSIWAVKKATSNFRACFVTVHNFPIVKYRHRIYNINKISARHHHHHHFVTSTIRWTIAKTEHSHLHLDNLTQPWTTKNDRLAERCMLHSYWFFSVKRSSFRSILNFKHTWFFVFVFYF